jgi:L-cysteine/cystine lyase
VTEVTGLSLDEPAVEAFRAELPALKSVAYLNTGTSGPLPIVVADAMTAEVDEQRDSPRLGAERGDRVRELKRTTRLAIARVFGCEDEEIALTHNTTEGMNLATLGVNWQPGDEAVTTNVEHPGALYPLYAARERFNITIKTAAVAGKDPEACVEEITRLLSTRTKLVSLSHVSFQTGQLLPIREICDAAHAVGALVLVDGAQSFGAISLDMDELGCDAYAVSGQKWLCGPEGSGALFVRQEVVSQLRIVFAAYGTMEGHNDYGGFQIRGNAQRFEQGTTNPAEIAGQLAAVRWLADDVGIERASQRSHALAEYAILKMKEHGLTVETPRAHAGLVTASLGGSDTDLVVRALREQAISIRSIRQLGAVRLSLGFFNTEEEIDSCVEAIDAVLHSPT